MTVYMGASRGILDERMDAEACFLDATIAFSNSTRPGGMVASIDIAGANSNYQKDEVVWKC